MPFAAGGAAGGDLHSSHPGKGNPTGHPTIFSASAAVAEGSVSAPAVASNLVHIHAALAVIVVFPNPFRPGAAVRQLE